MMSVIDAYHRRRGWLAYHVAALSRIDGEGFPTLENMMGMSPASAPEQSDADMLNALLSWQAVMGGRDRAH